MLLNFLKKKTGPVVKYDEDKKGYELINDGILFESEAIFLKWGSDIEADKLYIKKSIVPTEQFINGVKGPS